MALPKISQPLYQLTLPSTGQVVHYRPFTVREEKLLLIAQESKEKIDIVNTYKQLINNCCVEPLDVGQLATFDIEYFFINLRAKSVSNIAKVMITDSEDNEQYEVEFNLNNIEVPKKENIETKFNLTDTVGVVLKYPTFDAVGKLTSNKDDIALLVAACIHQIYEGEEVFDTANYTQKELEEFVLSLNKHQLEKIQLFLESIPKLVAKSKYVRKDGSVKDITIEGIESFF